MGTADILFMRTEKFGVRARRSFTEPTWAWSLWIGDWGLGSTAAWVLWLGHYGVGST